jgi:hypothetical protein
VRLLVGAVATLLACSADAGESVRIDDATSPSSCAENDNVYARFTAAGITHFTIEARHPAYIGTVTHDSTAPDFSTCDQSRDPSYGFEPMDVTLYEDADYKLVGHRFSRFWRPENVDFRVGDTVTRGLHLVQLLRKLPGRNIEILVVYPSDGYWRMKPLPPEGLADTAYGGSFLVGPIRQEGRPYVPLKTIAFDRSSLSFRLSFDDGQGEVRVSEASVKRTQVEISLPPAAHSIEFAALRSMFVSADMADTADARLTPSDHPPQRFPILAFPPMEITEADFARTVPSRHNTTAPDLIFSNFSRDR